MTREEQDAESALYGYNGTGGLVASNPDSTETFLSVTLVSQ